MGADRYEILSTLPPGAGTRTKLAWQAGDGGFRRAVVLREVPQGVELATVPSAPQSVLALLDEVDLEGRTWAVYEFVPGATFAEVSAAHLSVERLPSLGLIGRTVVDACRAIHQVHTFVDPLGLIPAQKHGGLSDASIFVGFDGRTRILDLGARRLGRFIAPEVTRGDQFDARADVFSLGAVLHHATTRFDKGYAVTIARAPSPQEFPPPSAVHPEASTELDAVVMRAMMPAPSSRFASALQLAEEIEAVLGPLLFTPDQVRTVLLPLFGDRLGALKELVDPKRRPLAPRPSAPRKRSPEPLIGGNIQLDGGAAGEIEDLPTQHNIKLPPGMLKPSPGVPDFDPHATNPDALKSPQDFDPNITTPGRPPTVAELAMARPSRPSGPKRTETVSLRRSATAPDVEKERAKGQEKISTADLDPDQLSPELRALQEPLLGEELEAEPTNIRPRPSQLAIQALPPQDEPGGYQDPKKREPTLDVDPADAPSVKLKPVRSSLRRRVGLAVLVIGIGLGFAVVKFRPDLLANLKARINPPLAPPVEDVLEDVDAGEPPVDPDAGAMVAPAVVDAGRAAVDAGEEDEDEVLALVNDGGPRDGGKGKVQPVKKKKKKRTR